ncbi:MAG: hypothetical protein JSU96_13230 [Acidobacteriota bacterium]|nr:MAG: hypothetical protein JSU96_13230 [Acidobacteriota bacterium]
MSNSKKRLDSSEMLRFLVEASPGIEPPPFFPARIAALASERVPRFESMLLALTKRLLPVLLSIAVLVCLVSYNVSRQPAESFSYFEILLDTGEQAEQITLEEVLASLEPLTSPGDADAD